MEAVCHVGFMRSEIKIDNFCLNTDDTPIMTNSQTQHDIDIVCQVLDGEVDAFEVLLNRYEGHVLRIVKKHVPYNQIEETAQEVFIRTYKSLPNFKPIGTFKQWLSSIAIRACYDCLRKHYRNREYPMSSLTEAQQQWLEGAMSKQAGQASRAADSRQDIREVLDWALDQLSPEDRMVMKLVYFEDRPVKEAAKLLGWSVANVKVRSFRSRKKLRKILGGR
jgi:RNA polymerase sigma-70 factor (ECF subfamily)